MFTKNNKDKRLIKMKKIKIQEKEEENVCLVAQSRCRVLCGVMMMENNTDMARRCYRIGMRAEVSDPDARDDFKYPDLGKHVLEQRGEILAALLTIARAWFVAECPMPEKKLRKVGSFTEWSHTTGGMLAYAGVEGFLENSDQLRKEADVDGAAWTRFLELWQSKLGDQSYKTADLIAHLQTETELAEALPTEYLATLY